MPRATVSILFLVISLLCATAPPVRRVMPWMCLERCGGNASSIAQDLASISAHRSILSAVSFEMFNLGPNGTLVLNNLTSVHQNISAMSLETHAMISSYPYPPQFLDWMRYVFANPLPFIATAIQATLTYNLSGLNVDWEPTTQPSASDAAAYAQFLDQFATAMHAHGKKLTVDVADWSPLWNFTLLGRTTLDRVITMSTYTNNSVSYLEGLANAVALLPMQKIGVGFGCYLALPPASLQARVDDMLTLGVVEIDVWVTPVPAYWWPQLARYATAPPQ